MPMLKVTHSPGRHCASTSIRNLVNHHGIPFSEAMCFGIGAGLGIWYLDFPGLPASRMIHVRSVDIEAQFFTRLGYDFSWEQNDDPEQSETALCRHLEAGRPAVIQTDIYYLPYYGSNTHFPGHLIAVWGYDPEKEEFFVTDTERPEPIAVPFADMRKARFFRNEVFDLRGNLFAPDNLALPPDLPGIIGSAVVYNSQSLTDPSSRTIGIRALETMLDELPGWAGFEDWRWAARFAYQVIEKRGTGGGGFRLMYADFLEEAALLVPRIASLGLASMMREAGRAWQNLAGALKSASEKEIPVFTDVSGCMETVIQTESEYHQAVLGGLAIN
jgi:hypothetical protein